jgi:hypothetical protein
VPAKKPAPSGYAIDKVESDPCFADSRLGKNHRQAFLREPRRQDKLPRRQLHFYELGCRIDGQGAGLITFGGKLTKLLQCAASFDPIGDITLSWQIRQFECANLFRRALQL